MKRLFLQTSLLSIVLLSAAMAQTSAPSTAVGSAFPAFTRGDRALAAGKAARKGYDFNAEGACLLQAFESAGTGDPEMDAVALRLAKFATTRDALRVRLLAKCDRDQLLRLVDACKSEKQFRMGLLFGEEFLRRFSADSKAADMEFDMGFCHMMVDSDEKRALELWRGLSSGQATTAAGRRAALYAEAVEGPQSIAALEAAFQMGVYQGRIVGNPYRGLFSDWRVIEAGEREFFSQYMTHPDIPAKDKAELLYKVAYAHYDAGHYERIAALADEIFGLVGFGTEVSEKAALMKALSYRMRQMHPDAVREFEEFLRAYPASRQAPDVCLYLGQSNLDQDMVPAALAALEVTCERYPGTKAAREATTTREMLLSHDSTGSWTASAEEKRLSLVARLRVPLDPATVWALDRSKFKYASAGALQKPSSTPASDPRFSRLSDILAAAR